MISGVFCTARQSPRFDYLADSLAIALAKCPHPFELLVIDKLLWEPGKVERRAQLDAAIKGRFSYRHIPPKPSAWQGPWRKTKRDYYDLNGARNTGLALARGSHVILLDDCTVFDEAWYGWHYRGAVQGVAVAGSFKTYSTAVVNNGRVMSGELHPGQDHRIEVSGPGAKPGHGAWMYGLNMSFPMKWALAVNGFDEKYSSQGGSEDVDFGVRLERAGCQMYFMPECIIYQILDTHEPVCETTAWGVPQHKPQKEKLLRDGKMHFKNELLIQDLLMDEPRRVLPAGNDFDLRTMRADALLTGEFPTARVVTHDWADGQPLEDMD